MKYLALALALLLAVSSHAVSARRDHGRPSDEDRQNIRGPPGQQTRLVDSLINYAKSARQNLALLANAAARTVMEATAELRAGIQADIDFLKRNTEEDRLNLENVLEKHKQGYIDEISSQLQDSDLENLKGKLRTTIDSLKSKFEDYKEETKSAILPILNVIHAKLVERAGQAKEAVAPYAQDFKDRVKGYSQKIFKKAQDIRTGDMVVLQRKVSPLAKDIGTKLQQIFGIVSETFSEE